MPTHSFAQHTCVQNPKYNFRRPICGVGVGEGGTGLKAIKHVCRQNCLAAKTSSDWRRRVRAFVTRRRVAHTRTHAHADAPTSPTCTHKHTHAHTRARQRYARSAGRFGWEGGRATRTPIHRTRNGRPTIIHRSAAAVRACFGRAFPRARHLSR